MISVQKSTALFLIMALSLSPFALHANGAKAGMDPERLAKIPVRMKAFVDEGTVAGVVTHVPAGLGVLEAVFVACLADVATPTVLAALLSYRAVYYLVPLALASIGYAAGEVSRRSGEVQSATRRRATQH